MSHPKISGFTFIKNGISLGYPIAESIQCLEPLCDEIIINIGFDDPELKNDDGTEAYLKKTFTGSKFKFLKSWWDPALTSQGLILSQQTNIALKECQGDICQYIQGDECIHEDDYEKIKQGYLDLHENPVQDGLVFSYIHFYGNVDAYLHTRRIYKREVRAIKNRPEIYSHLDAQGFRLQGDKKLKCTQIDAKIFHYGWARAEKVMARKIKVMDKLYHGKDFEKNDYFGYKKIWGIKKFQYTHPQVMHEWIESNRNQLDIHSLPLDFQLKDTSLAVSDFIEFITGYRVGEYKNFVLL